MNNYREYDKSTLEKLHTVHLELMDEFVRICEEKNLTYFLIGGTYLGALRHNGFIPWDDDMDVGMPRNDYEKFIEYAKEKLNKKYYLDCFATNKDYYLPFAKLKKNGTIFDEEKVHHLNNHKGIYIDIFPIDNVPNNNLNLKLRAIMAISISDNISYRYKIKKLKETLHPFIVLLLMLLPREFLMKWQKKIVTYCKDNNSKYLCDIGTGYGYRKELLPREAVFPIREIVFCKRKYKCMHDDTYLKQIYGDYMKLPPKEKRRNHMPLKIEFGDNNE